jgi:protocatechuate 3,4-dioxygenase alpha subunit
MKLRATPSQTIGPFFQIGMARLCDDDIAKGAKAGERVVVRGRVLDGKGAGVPDAVIEIWQANAHGKYAHPDDAEATRVEDAFTGFGRVPTGEHGEFVFKTIKPGAVTGPDGNGQAPHLVMSIFMRGLLTRLLTRMYFPDDARNEEDFVLRMVAPERRGTLIARRGVTAEDGVLEWNIVLQGKGETVFFDC